MKISGGGNHHGMPHRRWGQPVEEGLSLPLRQEDEKEQRKWNFEVTGP